MKTRLDFNILILLAIGLSIALPNGGCKQESDPSKAISAVTGHASVGPEASGVPIDLSAGWCGGHGVPESVCTRCNSSLIQQFKDAGDWCAEHELPESQCTLCHPEVAGQWAELNPKGEPPTVTEKSREPGKTAGLPADTASWCPDHGVPKAICTRCDPKLATGFKEAGDWCAEHGLPESQCILCNPDLRDQLAQMRPDAMEPSADRGANSIQVDRPARLFRADNDPLCQVENLKIRFLDVSTVHKAGIGIAPAERRAMSAVLEVPTEVEFDDTRVTRVTARIGGIVREAPVQAGELVTKGALLAVLDSPALGEAKSSHIERRQDYLLAKSDLDRAKGVSEGIGRMLEVCTPTATAAEILRQLDGVQVGEAKARLLGAHAALQLARAQAERQAGLVEAHIVSEKDHQTAQRALAGAEADFLATREQIVFTSERELLSADRGVRVAKGSLDSAERHLHILGLSEDQIAAIGTEADDFLTRFELRSPAQGRVVERRLVVGESIAGEDVLFVIADTESMWLVGNVPDRELPRLREGLRVLFTVDSFPGHAFEGQVVRIGSEVNDRTRTVRVISKAANPDGLLRAKMFGTARLILRDNDDVISVPEQAIQTDSCCQLVFVREREDVFVPRKVVLGSAVNGFVEVLKGLQEGEMVATSGSFLMKSEILKGNLGAGCCEVDPGR